MYVVACLARLARLWIKKKREMNYLSVKCWVYTGVCIRWLVWLGSEQTSQLARRNFLLTLTYHM